MCNNIANELIEGGGHEYAAGGKMKSDSCQIDEVLKELENATETWLKKKKIEQKKIIELKIPQYKHLLGF